MTEPMAEKQHAAGRVKKTTKKQSGSLFPRAVHRNMTKPAGLYLGIEPSVNWQKYTNLTFYFNTNTDS